MYSHFNRFVALSRSVNENDVVRYAKNATVKTIITINKYNVGMKSLDRAIIVSDTLQTETSPIFISWVRVPVPVPDSGFRIPAFPYARWQRRKSVFVAKNWRNWIKSSMNQVCFSFRLLLFPLCIH